VYAGSEGLSVLVIDKRAFGGQAGASAASRTTSAFPPASPGQALTGRGFTQAQKFGARMLIPMEINRLECLPDGSRPIALHLGDGRTVHARTIVIATGARYRRPDCSNLMAMEGRGVWYWASPVEAKMCAGEEVVLVGGGNSAGQAAVFLSAHARKVWMLVRGPGLAASMSKYLIDRIAATPNIELLTRTELTHISGSHETGIESVSWTNHATGREETRPIRNVFLFLGAEPSTEWLKECDVSVDDKGFVATGGDPVLPLQTSVPGVFAIGDVRAGSVKRVGRRDRRRGRGGRADPRLSRESSLRTFRSLAGYNYRLWAAARSCPTWAHGCSARRRTGSSSPSSPTTTPRPSASRWRCSSAHRSSCCPSPASPRITSTGGACCS
jgi:thioredoxin reductase (NADPH)